MAISLHGGACWDGSRISSPGRQYNRRPNKYPNHYYNIPILALPRPIFIDCKLKIANRKFKIE
jgi:hypothetical protein